MVTTRFHSAQDGEFECIKLVREAPSRIPLVKPTIETVAFDDWTLTRPPGAAAALGRLLKALGDGETAPDKFPLVTIQNNTARLHPALVADLTDVEAQSLGLAPTVRLALDLQSSGLIHQSGFRVAARWVRMGGAAVIAQVQGARISYGGKDWRLPEPIYSTLRNVAAINHAEDEAGRLAALSRLKRTIGDEAGDRIMTDGVIERLRIAYASGFSLSLKASAQGFDFDPVLFSHERLETTEAGAVLDESADSLLPPKLAEDFARRFRRASDSRRTYLLEDGSLLFLDPALTRALTTVRKAQAGGIEERKAFARNPQRAISQALRAYGNDLDGATPLFIETQQFSERVAGIDICRKPVLPWIKPKPNNWLPEKFGLWIGDPPQGLQLEIAPDKVDEVKAALERALHEERGTFIYDGVEIPATQQTHAAVSDIAALVAASQQAKLENDEVSSPPDIVQRYFLQVRDNLQDVAYAPLAAAMVEEASDIAMPAVLLSQPKPHQVDGFTWLANNWRSGIPGCLLADDMGLGKTFQALAFLSWVRSRESSIKPILIVAPTGLLANWRAEIERHLAPQALGVVINAYGASLGRMREGRGRDIELGESRIDIDGWSRAGVILTTYETMRDYHLSFARQPFSVIVYDEVQKLKNPASQMTRAAKTLHARFQLAMTGTPVENRLQDLWSIYDVIYPGLLGSSKHFESSYPGDQPERLKELHHQLATPVNGRPPALLRRMKDDCLTGMPIKTVQAIPAAMPPAQRIAYDKVIARAMAVKGTGQRGRMLEILQHLRGVSLHPLDPDAGGNEGYFADSARTKTLFELLQAIADKREKVLIFCESLAMQALLAVEIARRFKLDHAVSRIHGGVTGDLRQTAVNVFQERPAGFDAMILSPKAGGVGLTLTAANHVIHLSRWWNPAVEDQATDRAYRIGQSRDVTVYLPQAIHPDQALRQTSFDLKLHELMERKRRLSRDLLAPGEDEADVSDLFDAVVNDAPIAPSPEPSTVDAREAETSSADTPSIAPGAATRNWPTRVVFEPDRPRDLRIFQLPLANDPAIEITIIDPYAAANDRVRDQVVQFAGMIWGNAPRNGISRARLVTYDAESVGGYVPETTQHQYEDLQRRWGTAFQGKLFLHHVQRSKRQARDLHDREVRVISQSGKTFVWDLGRGIEGTMGRRFGCRVTLTEE